MCDFVQIDAEPVSLIHLLNRMEHSNHGTKSELVLLLGLPSTLTILTPNDSVVHAIHHDVMHLELQIGHSVHQLYLLDEEFTSLSLLLLILRILLLLKNKSVKVCTSRVLALHFFRHHNLHLLANLLLIFLVIVLPIELLNVRKFVVLCDCTDHLVSHIEKSVNLTNPESLLMEELKLHPVEAEVMQHVAVSKHLRALLLLLFLTATFSLKVIDAADRITLLCAELKLAELLVEEFV